MQRSLSVGLAFAVAIAALPATALDYQALFAELQVLKADPAVIACLGRDIRTAHELERTERAMKESLQMAKVLLEQARQRRATRALALGGALSGDPALQKAGELMMREGESPEVLEMEAAQSVENARDALVELVSSYREVKAQAIAKTPTGKRPTRP